MWSSLHNIMLSCKMQEILRNNGQPGDMWLTSIWSLAGQVLLDVPDCLVQLVQAVNTLISKDPPEYLLDSPVREVSECQAHIAEALDATSLTAQTVRQSAGSGISAGWCT